MEELVPRCTLSRFLILLKTSVISYLVKNLCIESINGWFGYRSVEFINPKEGEGGTKKEVSLFSMKLRWALFLASALPTPWHHFSYLWMAMHGHPNPFQSPLSNQNPKPNNSMREFLCANPPFLHLSYPPNSTLHLISSAFWVSNMG